MSERSCETCRHNLALCYDPCPECAQKNRWEAMPPAAITAYPHQCEGLKTLHPGAEVMFIKSKFSKSKGTFYYYNGITTYVDVLYCPGCGGRCL